MICRRSAYFSPFASNGASLLICNIVSGFADKRCRRRQQLVPKYHNVHVYSCMQILLALLILLLLILILHYIQYYNYYTTIDVYFIYKIYYTSLTTTEQSILTLSVYIFKDLQKTANDV